MSSPQKIYAILLAGGSGTRLWPLSRRLTPKHLLAFIGKQSLLQQTASRLMVRIPPERVVTVTHEDHVFEARDQLGALDPGFKSRILAEPESRNTLPAIAWAVRDILKEEPEATIGVFPSDHWIQDEKAFGAAIDRAAKVAEDGYLVTLGTRPTRPETGYGYIHAGRPLDHSGAFEVKAFVEKPDLETAREYLRQGNFYWNSGLFVFRASVFQGELKRLQPALFESIRTLGQKGYASLPNLSIDYGIMEKAKRVAVIPAQFLWNDLGSWEAVYEQNAKDESKNVIQGNILSQSTHSSLLISKKGLLATIGLRDVVVVQTEDAVLVSPRNRVQEVKALVEKLRDAGSPLVESRVTVSRPWGKFTVLHEAPGCKIKEIVVNSGQKLSLQSHKNRSEHWVVVSGIARVTRDKEVFDLQVNESTIIPQGGKHRLENAQNVPLTIIEVQTGSYLGEDDIERFDDAYGRVDKK